MNCIQQDMFTDGECLWVTRKTKKKTDRFATVGLEMSKQSWKIRTIDTMVFFSPYPLPSTQSLNRANNSFCKLVLHLK